MIGVDRLDAFASTTAEKEEKGSQYQRERANFPLIQSLWRLTWCPGRVLNLGRPIRRGRPRRSVHRVSLPARWWARGQWQGDLGRQTAALAHSPPQGPGVEPFPGCQSVAYGLPVQEVPSNSVSKVYSLENMGSMKGIHSPYLSAERFAMPHRIPINPRD